MKLHLVSNQRPDEAASDDLPRQSAESDKLRHLVPLVIGGDAAAERTLLVAVGSSVLAIVRRTIGARHPDVEDLCQESFLAILGALPSFRGQCSVLHFACRVALFTALAARRRHRYGNDYRLDPTERDDELSDAKPNPAELFDQFELRTALRQLLDELPMDQAEVLALHLALGHTIEEISAMTNTNLNTIRSRLQRGLLALRTMLANRPVLFALLRGHHD